MWCLNQFPPESDSFVSFLIDEWTQSHKWVSYHVSDHSGFHYRQHLLSKFIRLPASVLQRFITDVEQYSLWSLKLFSSPSQISGDSHITDATKYVLNKALGSHCEIIESVPLGLILSELLLNSDLLFVYPGHEAIWYHRRFMLQTFRDVANNMKVADCQHKDNNGVSLEKAKRVDTFRGTLMQRLLTVESALYIRCKAEKDRQANLAEKHRAWLLSIMKVNLQLPLN